MKKYFQRNASRRLDLTRNTLQNLKSHSNPLSVQLNVSGFSLLENIKKKTEVFSGTLLAEHPSPAVGDLFSPIDGIVESVDKNLLSIKAADPEQTSSNENFEPLPRELEGPELAFRLKKLGVNLNCLVSPCETLIINGLNPDPSIAWAEALLQNEKETLLKGFEVCERLTQAKNVILALPKDDAQATLYKNYPTLFVKPRYPNNLDPLLLKQAAKTTSPKNVSIVNLLTVWSVGRVASLGRPLTETIITIGGPGYSENYVVKDGTTIKELIALNGLPVKDKDSVVIGGLFQGESVDRLQRGVTKESKGIFIAPPTTTSMERKYPCVNCGACASVCPARLNPDLLSRYAEFNLYEKCRKEFIEACFECGLCSYVCIARRPILEQIRLTKRSLNISINNVTTESPSENSHV